MPYIKQSGRPPLTVHIKYAVDALVTNFPELGGRTGAVNYVITRIVLGALRPSEGWSYQSLSRAVAVLHDAAHEIQRRLLDVYESNARDQNGDIEELDSLP